MNFKYIGQGPFPLQGKRPPPHGPWGFSPGFVLLCQEVCIGASCCCWHAMLRIEQRAVQGSGLALICLLLILFACVPFAHSVCLCFCSCIGVSFVLACDVVHVVVARSNSMLE